MIGTSFLRVAAHDDDFGTNAAVTYSMSDEQPEYLRVNPLTGWVYVNQPISQVHLPLFKGLTHSFQFTVSFRYAGIICAGGFQDDLITWSFSK